MLFFFLKIQAQAPYERIGLNETELHTSRCLFSDIRLDRRTALDSLSEDSTRKIYKARTTIESMRAGHASFPRNAPYRSQPKGFKTSNIQWEEQQKAKNAITDSTRHAYLPHIQLEDVSCGFWSINTDYGRENIEFRVCCSWNGLCNGTLVFGSRNAAILLPRPSRSSPSKRIDISHASVENIVIGDNISRDISFTMKHPPRLYELIFDEVDELFSGAGATHANGHQNFSIEQAFKGLSLGGKVISNTNHASKKRLILREKVRLSAVDPSHEGVAGRAFVYRVKVNERSWIKFVSSAHRAPGLPKRINLSTRRSPLSGLDVLRSIDKAVRCLSDDTATESLSFSIRFQLLRLLQSSIPPSLVMGLFFIAIELNARYNHRIVSESLRSFTKTLPCLAPGEDLKQFDLTLMASGLQSICAAKKVHGTLYESIKATPHMLLVYRAQVSPCAIVLSGPYPETTNRVLRRYADHIEYFLRVSFTDEDGDQFWNEGRTDTSKCFERFAAVLKSPLVILDRLYSFLGFSHSSLRTQTCWFLAPYYETTSNVADVVINDLGNFAIFHNPAKAAARLGQTFTDTASGVKIAPTAIAITSDVERNGFCFSDGCGKISEAQVQAIQKVYGKHQDVKSTAYQIRYGGAKGMLSLDTSLPEDLVVLRRSMIKFEARGELEIEICGSANSPSQAYLNKQLIKILEDLGVKPQVFIDLLDSNIMKLERFGRNPFTAANLLKFGQVSDVTNMANLIRRLHLIGLDFSEDTFLSQMVRMAGLIALQELKYRARIPLENDWETGKISGITLYGIMDETGFLQEGEIYCPTQISKCPLRILKGRCVVTRAPSLFPGDVQVVRAVDVPSGSMLRNLCNVVVFSKNGARDLASQLSGGDLDGDKFSIIFDPRLIPPMTAIPALIAKPRQVDIGRPVTRLDMADWFCEFMKNDRLGQICNLHLQMADRDERGTLCGSCVDLAHIAAQAVDFSKTGVSIDTSRLGQFYKRLGPHRPDFMAESPRIELVQNMVELEEDVEPDDQDPYSALNRVKRKKYYESQKVLGVLFRRVDERDFLRNLVPRREMASGDKDSNLLLRRAFKYIKVVSRGIQYEHHLNFARNVRQE